MYSCWEIEEDLFSIIKEKNAEKYCIYIKLIEHYGRILQHDAVSLKGELGRHTHWNLLKKIESNMLIKLVESNKYKGNDDIWITFVIFR